MQIDSKRAKSLIRVRAALAVIPLFPILVWPVQAIAHDGTNVATLAAPLAQPRQEILGGVLWKCAGERCSALADGSRPVLVCTRVAREFGAVARFATPGGEMAADDLARCNAR